VVPLDELVRPGADRVLLGVRGIGDVVRRAARLVGLEVLERLGLDIENAGSASAAGNLLVTLVIAMSTVDGSFTVQLLKRLAPSVFDSFWAKPPKMVCQ
jgi:hypothetical protein